MKSNNILFLKISKYTNQKWPNKWSKIAKQNGIGFQIFFDIFEEKNQGQVITGFKSIVKKSGLKLRGV